MSCFRNFIDSIKNNLFVFGEIMNEQIIENGSEKLRKKWLLCSLFVSFGLPILAAGFFGFKGSIDDVVDVISGMIISTPDFLILYYCAYRKHGNIVLTFRMVITGILLVVVVAFILMLVPFIDAKMLEPMSPFILSVGLLVHLWWFNLSLKLRKINIGIQKQINAFSG